jgi:outer membrane protein TolC
MKKHIIAIILCCSIGAIAQEEKAYTFSLEEAITFAIDSNYQTINSRREIAKALQQKWETTASGLPQINANVAYQNNIKQPVSLLPAAAFDNTTSVVNTVEEFFGIQANQEPTAPEGFIPVIFGTPQNLNATATLNQLIFDGSYLVGLKAAKSFLRYSENLNEKTSLEVRKGVINAYGSVLLAEELIAIFEKNKTALEKNLYETRKIYENGLTEEENVEQLEITLLDLDTQINNTIRSLKIAKQMFNLSLGIEINISVTLTENLDALAQDNISLTMLDASAPMEENVDFKIAQNLTEQRDLEMKLEKSKALPSLGAFINYGTAAFGDDFSFFDSDQRWFQSSAFGVSLNVPIFSSGMRSARTQKAKIALEQANTQLEETKQQINLALDSAKSNYRFSIEKYENAKKNIALAERIENKNRIKFTEGLSTSFDLRQAQTQLFNAQQQYFQSMLDVINTKAEIETVLNTPNLRVTADQIKNQF